MCTEFWKCHWTCQESKIICSACPHSMSVNLSRYCNKSSQASSVQDVHNSHKHTIMFAYGVKAEDFPLFSNCLDENEVSTSSHCQNTQIPLVKVLIMKT